MHIIFQYKVNICVVYQTVKSHIEKNKAGKEDWEEGSKGGKEGCNLK